MRRSTWAALTAVVLVVGLSVAAALQPVPYVTFSPGPTVNVLGKFDGKSIITVAVSYTHLTLPTIYSV